MGRLGYAMVEYKRARKDTTILADRKTWDSRCGLWRLQEFTNHSDGISRYYALMNTDNGWRMLDHMKTYKTRRASERAIEEYLRGKSKWAKALRKRK